MYASTSFETILCLLKEQIHVWPPETKLLPRNDYNSSKKKAAEEDSATIFSPNIGTKKG